MTWHAHPLRVVQQPTVLPLSLPAGTTALQGYQRALTVPVLLAGEGFAMYRAIWQAPKAKAFSGVPAKLIDWSSTK